MKERRNILVITYWPLTNALVSTYTIPYLRIIQKLLPAGSTIYLFTLTPSADRKSAAYTATRMSLEKEGFKCHDFTYRKFGPLFLLSAPLVCLSLWWLVLSKGIRNLHCWCTPGGAIGYLLSLLTGRALILDSFEPHSDAMVETGTWKTGSLSYKLLFALEKRQLRRASHVICAAPGMMEYASERYGISRPEKYIKPACVDLDKFRPSTQQRDLQGILEQDITCVYAGKFGGIYLEQETFDFFAEGARYWPGRFRVVLLTSHSEQEILSYCEKSQLNPAIVERRFVPHAEVPALMNLADFGICPVKPVPTKKYCSPIKNGEYWALGLPVVITPDISVDSDLIVQHEAGAVITSFTTTAYREALAIIERILKDATHKQRIRQLAITHRNFEIAEKVYAGIYTQGASRSKVENTL